MIEEIKNFKVEFYSKDGQTSPVIDYLVELVGKNQQLALKSIHNIQRLPFKIIENSDIKPIKIGKIKFWELRIQSGINISRFFFTVKNPKVIVLFGFTKKTQKTEQKDLNMGEKFYNDYIQNQKSIPFGFPKGFLD